MLKKEKLEKVQNKSASVIQVQNPGILNLKSFNDIFKKESKI